MEDNWFITLNHLQHVNFTADYCRWYIESHVSIVLFPIVTVARLNKVFLCMIKQLLICANNRNNFCGMFKPHTAVSHFYIDFSITLQMIQHCQTLNTGLLTISLVLPSITVCIQFAMRKFGWISVYVWHWIIYIQLYHCHSVFNWTSNGIVCTYDWCLCSIGLLFTFTIIISLLCIVWFYNRNNVIFWCQECIVTSHAEFINLCRRWNNPITSPFELWDSYCAL